MRQERGVERLRQHRWQEGYVMPQHYRGNSYKVDYKTIICQNQVVTSNGTKSTMTTFWSTRMTTALSASWDSKRFRTMQVQ